MITYEGRYAYSANILIYRHWGVYETTPATPRTTTIKKLIYFLPTSLAVL